MQFDYAARKSVEYGTGSGNDRVGVHERQLAKTQEPAQ